MSHMLDVHRALSELLPFWLCRDLLKMTNSVPLELSLSATLPTNDKCNVLDMAVRDCSTCIGYYKTARSELRQAGYTVLQGVLNDDMHADKFAYSHDGIISIDEILGHAATLFNKGGVEVRGHFPKRSDKSKKKYNSEKTKERTALKMKNVRGQFEERKTIDGPNSNQCSLVLNRSPTTDCNPHEKDPPRNTTLIVRCFMRL